ncbi:MAG: FKBP-type peptidyl-prolyl cis-trans isomerase [Bacteroidales bacterium]|nr:FKBP-type peptidyl-prolyl cis-trans isomerase [Bacteroidales bacterium]
MKGKVTYRLLRFPTLLLPTLLLMACPVMQEEVPSSEDSGADWEEHRLDANRELVKIEKEHIESYISRYGWEMFQTGSGLRYMVYRDIDGQRIIPGSTVHISFTMELLTGEQVGASNIRKHDTLRIGHSMLPVGLEEALMLLNTGDKARVILPSHLAYGMTGDPDKGIPSMASLVCDVEVIELIDKPDKTK